MVSEAESQVRIEFSHAKWVMRKAHDPFSVLGKMTIIKLKLKPLIPN